MKFLSRGCNADVRFKAAGILAGSLLSIAPHSWAAAIGLTVNPAAITNDYIGKITLGITNLTAGKTVTVDWFADMNTNGVIDAGDVLTESFQVTDGQVPLVAGVRNLNVRGDDDGLTNGQIQAALYFPSASGGNPLVKSLFRVSDPTGSLTSVTQAFAIVQRVYPQGITGRVTSSATGLPLTNTILGLEGTVGTIGGFTVSDNNGNYSFYCLPGLYVVVGLNANGAVYDQAALVSVACGQTVTNNLIVTNGTFFIAGRVTDGATGLGIPALSVDANTANNLAVQTLTDTNGNYAVQVTTNTWSIHPSTGSAPEAGYVDPTRIDVSITSSSTSNISFVLSKPTALIYGAIKDAWNTPVVGVQMSPGDRTTRFHAAAR